MAVQGFFEISESVPHHKFSDVSHEAALFGQLDENSWTDIKSFFVGPAHQSFSPLDPPALQAHDGLIDHAQPVTANLSAKLLRHAPVAPVEEGEEKTEAGAGQATHGDVSAEFGAI